MGNRRDTDFVVDVLSQVVGRGESNDARLAHGAKLRKEVQEAVVSTGGPVDHYRYAWLAECAGHLMDILSIMAKEFDQKHPDDMCSAQDLMDVLRVTYTRMASAFETIAEKQKTGT